MSPVEKTPGDSKVAYAVLLKQCAGRDCTAWHWRLYLDGKSIAEGEGEDRDSALDAAVRHRDAMIRQGHNPAQALKPAATKASEQPPSAAYVPGPDGPCPPSVEQMLRAVFVQAFKDGLVVELDPHHGEDYLRGLSAGDLTQCANIVSAWSKQWDAYYLRDR